MSHRPAHVLAVGATGSIGRRVVAAAQRHELHVTALVRDLERGERILPGINLVRGDLEQPATLAAVVREVDAIVFTHGTQDSRTTPEGWTTEASPTSCARSADGGRGSR